MRQNTVAIVSQWEPDLQEVIDSARTFVDSNEHERIQFFYKLRQERRLMATVRGLNGLLARPDHRDLGLSALRSIGLEYAD